MGMGSKFGWQGEKRKTVRVRGEQFGEWCGLRGELRSKKENYILSSARSTLVGIDQMGDSHEVISQDTTAD